MNLNVTTGDAKLYAVTYVPTGREPHPVTVTVSAVSSGTAVRAFMDSGVAYARILKAEPIGEQ